jgi:hypothetical protein
LVESAARERIKESQNSALILEELKNRLTINSRSWDMNSKPINNNHCKREKNPLLKI